MQNMQGMQGMQDMMRKSVTRRDTMRVVTLDPRSMAAGGGASA